MVEQGFREAGDDEPQFKKLSPEDATVDMVESSDENMRSYIVYGARFDVPKRYQIIEPVGTGAYGIVVAAVDTELKE